MHRAVPLVIALVGVVIAVVGLCCATPAGPDSFGWTAYSPLSEQVYRPSVMVPRWALALVAIGSATTGAAITAAVRGRRRSR